MVGKHSWGWGDGQAADPEGVRSQARSLPPECLHGVSWAGVWGPRNLSTPLHRLPRGTTKPKGQWDGLWAGVPGITAAVTGWEGVG